MSVVNMSLFLPCVTLCFLRVSVIISIRFINTRMCFLIVSSLEVCALCHLSLCIHFKAKALYFRRCNIVIDYHAY